MTNYLLYVCLSCSEHIGACPPYSPLYPQSPVQGQEHRTYSINYSLNSWLSSHKSNSKSCSLWWTVSTISFFSEIEVILSTSQQYCDNETHDDANHSAWHKAKVCAAVIITTNITTLSRRETGTLSSRQAKWQASGAFVEHTNLSVFTWASVQPLLQGPETWSSPCWELTRLTQSLKFIESVHYSLPMRNKTLQ